MHGITRHRGDIGHRSKRGGKLFCTGALTTLGDVVLGGQGRQLFGQCSSRQSCPKLT